MNAFKQIDSSAPVAGFELVECPVPEPACALEPKPKSRAARRISCALLVAAAIGAAGYFFATASLIAILAVLGAGLACLGLLAAFGIYVLDHVR